MNLIETLTLIAAQIKADPNELIRYAGEDGLGGYHLDETQRKFPSGSLWGVEGQILYALARHLKPATIVEIGGWAGASASHLAAAVIANGMGRVISVDSGVGGQDHGYLLTPEYRQHVELIKADGREWLATQPDGMIGLLFEDADHSTSLTAELTALALRKCAAGGVIVNHDAAHDFAYVGGGQIVNSSVGREVRDGLMLANAYFKPYLAEPSDCGVAITVVPHKKQVSEPKSGLFSLQMTGALSSMGGVNQYMNYGIAPIETASVEPPPPDEAKPVRKTRTAKTPK